MHVCMYACMHVCMYACMHVCMYACMHVCMYACMHGCMDAWMHGCMDAWMHGCMYACMHVCMYACMHVCMYACMHVCMYAVNLPSSLQFSLRSAWCNSQGLCSLSFLGSGWPLGAAVVGSKLDHLVHWRGSHISFWWTGFHAFRYWPTWASGSVERCLWEKKVLRVPLEFLPITLVAELRASPFWFWDIHGRSWRLIDADIERWRRWKRRWKWIPPVLSLIIWWPLCRVSTRQRTTW